MVYTAVLEAVSKDVSVRVRPWVRIVLWYNGSTGVFGTSSRGSNP